MPRTKADAYVKAGGKASRKPFSISKPQAKSIKIKKSRQLNKAVKRPIPKWQNPITDFFSKDIEKVVSEVDILDQSNGEKFDKPSHSGKIENLYSDGEKSDKPGCSKESIMSSTDGEDQKSDSDGEDQKSDSDGVNEDEDSSDNQTLIDSPVISEDDQ